MKKKKTMKKVLSLLLSFVMLVTCFSVAIPMAKAQGETINGITQTRIVPDGTYQSVYASYAAAYLNGYGEPTELVIPGLSADDNYVVQGITYYPAKDWVLVTAYHNSDSPSPSMVYCIDVKTGDFVAMFSFKNVDGSANTDHGGGIAISENNIYYSCGDTDRSIAYAPLSAIEGIENDATKYREVQLVAEQTFYETGSVADGDKTAYTAYCCYDQGVLWTGNFYDEGTLGGLIAADYDVKAHSSYPSMVWGYELSGEGPEEEWANLTSGNLGSQGNPSYVVALPSDIKDVQYATVDDGRLYLSRSYGTGTETCQNFGMEPYSQLSIADIDLTVGGSGTITFTTDANGTTRTVTDAYIVPSMQTFDFMPMSEGLCVIDDYIYMTFESATYKYYEDAGIMGNCDMPVDVVWKIDQYGLLGHERPDENEVTAYQKVNDVSEISSTDEYIIVYESEMQAEGNQNNILYALNSYGGYQGDRLPKTDAGTVANTMDSMGMIGHEITDYHTYMNENGDEYLILGNAAKDDLPNIRWNLIGAGTGAMRFHSVDLYNAEYSYLYFDQRLMYMSTEANTNLNNIVLMNKAIDGVTYPGEFWIYNSANSSYLWCNDGSDESIMTAYNNYYQTGDATHKYYQQTEVAGTFHADALKTASGNATGNQASALPAPYKLGTFNIYKRITTDPNAIGGTGLETDLKAELQADGTYTINLGTYATSEAHKYLGESGYPTDFMFVLDASSSMTNSSDYVTYSNQGNLNISRGMANDSTGYYVYVDKVTKTDGTVIDVNEFCRLEGHYSGFLINVKYWVTADSQTGSEEYMVGTDGKFYWSQSQIQTVSGSDTTITQALPVYRKVTTTRLQGMKDTVNSFISKIDDNAQTYNIEHRVGITTYGSNADESYVNTGIYSTLSGTALNTYGADLSAHYAAAFYPSNHSNLATIVNNINTSTGDPDTFANYGMEMAVNAYAQQSPAYGGAGDRYYSDFTDSEGIFHEKNANAVVIFLTDGCPGYGGTDTTTATTVANAAIPSAQAIKGAGGAVYSIQVSDATMDGFDMSAYMNGVSSNYPSASSLTALGTQSSSDYYVKASTDGTVDVGVVLDDVFEHIEDNFIDIGTSITLGTDSIVRHALGEHFKLTDSSKVSVSTSSISEDVLGNIMFGNNTALSGITPTVDTTSNTIQVTGFDYSSNYYAKGTKEGKRLNIVIDNVLPVDTDEISMDISNQTYTAIYEDATNMSNNRKFKGYPNVSFAIPEYTYVLDYDMPMLDTDINGTVVSVDGELKKQDTNNYNVSRESDNVALKLKDNGLNMTYELVSGAYTEEDNRTYCLIKRDDGTYDWFRINIVPASNVLFEENRFTASSLGSLAKSNWKTEGSAIATGGQSLSGENDRYGYDSAYANNGDSYSNGTVLKATVNSTTKRSETMTFSYTGTGFDLMAVCGANTGIQLVNIKNADGTIEKVYMVDTYYVDTENYDGALLKQVPIVNHTNEEYGEYTVEVTAAYLTTAQGVTGGRSSLFNKTYTAQDLLKDMGITANKVEYVWFNDNSVLNGGTGPAAKVTSGTRGTSTASNVSLDCYIDSIRVYNPLGDDSSLYINSEKGAKYYNIVNELASGENGVITGGNGLFAYVVGELSADEDGNIPTLSFGNYQSVGPQNEIYLQTATGSENSHAVAFNVAVPNADSRVMISLRAVDGATTAKVASGDEAIEFAINTATEQYFDITPYLTINASTGVANVIITNIGSGLLSVNNLKLVDATAQAVTSEDLPAMARSLSLRPRTVDPNSYDYDAIVDDNTQQPDVDTPVDDNTDVEIPVVVENIFTRIIAFFKKLFGFIFKTL